MASNQEKIEDAVAVVADSPTTPVGKTPTEANPKSIRIKATRHPRWTRQETLVLIQAKKMIENGEQVCRYKSASGFVHQIDPKWDTVSSFCQRQGVMRGPVQCRKRWGNLLTDFRKIKKWESGIKEEAESFWMMRNDRRKEKKLPGFFDEVVYRVLDGGVCTASAFPLTLIKMTTKPVDQVEGVGLLEQSKEDEDDEGQEDEAIVDGEKMGWSTEEENTKTNTTGNMVIISPLKTPCTKETIMKGSPKITPIPMLPTLEKQQQPSCQGNYDPGCLRKPMSQEKRRRLSPDNCGGTTNFGNNIIKLLRRNTNILKAHFGAQNMNYQLAREEGAAEGANRQLSCSTWQAHRCSDKNC